MLRSLSFFNGEGGGTHVGAALSDLWLLVLIISFSAGNHFARTQALKRLQLALEDRERANAKLQQATKAKTDFLANMSHGKERLPSIRTPHVNTSEERNDLDLTI